MDQGASTSSSPHQYQVFLSFCGKDTRYGFTDFLYTLFDRAGIPTFRDDNELRVGEEIGAELIKAIKESKISIPVLSKNYASSKWCLREIEQMVKFRKSEGQKIYPIFYEIEPSDVRHQSGRYKKAFIQHQKRFNEETVQGWKDALTMVAQLKGPVKKIDKPQGELANEVFEEVLLELKTNHARLPDYLVGMEHHEKEMEKLLNANSSDVRIVVIHGMGGLGKTTIAKFIYNKLSDCFHYCCFLENVGPRSQDLVKLQNELISAILKRNSNDGGGISGIEAAVSGRKVFIVLDDVVEKSQFDDLVGKCERFGPGSRIIVTTRNKEDLHRLERTCQSKGKILAHVHWSYYEPTFMSDHHSLQLFSKHAFTADSPPLDYIELSKKFVHYAAGLPLVLETIGSSLIGEDATSWEDTLTKLKEIPNKDVMGKLRISFNALDDAQKQIFLDIACFFIGEKKTIPCYMWEDLKFFSRSAINSLVLRSLVKVGDEDTLWMHDQLRDLGRKIVGEENFSYGNRLWDPVKAREQFENRTITEKVTGLCLNGGNEFRNFEGEEFGKLPNLRYLKVRDANLVGDFKHVFKNLRWLKWKVRGNRWYSVSTNFHLKNLLVLDLSFSNITDEWEGWSQIKMATKLKVLNLSHCYSFRTTSPISTFATLERLILQSCHGLREIDPSIGNLTKLKLLDLSYNFFLEGILDCSTFTALESLDVTSCWGLLRLDGLEKLESLRYLNLTCCRGLERFPDLSELKNLKELNIGRLEDLTEIEGLELLKSLEMLAIGECKSIEILDLSNLKNLKQVHACNCDKLIEIRGLEKLKSLEYLDIFGCYSLQNLPHLSDTSIHSHISKQTENLLEGMRCQEDGASTSSSAQQYKVFLSFCGKDTRHGFTDVLYTFFDRAGIRTFRDDNELRVGEEIGAELMKAIKESKILIPVLSKNYAFSKWCLREVEQMVKCRKSEGQKIYPIFYEIEPSDVRHQSGCYEQAFIQHQTSFDQETVRGWKEALTLVAQLKGRVTKIDEPQGELANEVLEEVLLELKTNHARLPDYLVGMEHHEKEMEKLLNANSSDVRIVVIHGMGGLGKTTIAKVIYNKLCDHFQYCCFLENVGTRSQDLAKLQKELISTTLKRKFNDGQGIEAAVYGRKVFIVLDDVVEKSQFDGLAGKCEWFGPGSRIIVTTRNKEDFDRLETTCQLKHIANLYWSYYEPEFMSPCHSLQLFSNHAFMADSPPPDYIELSKKFVDYAAGLPLVLETIGSSLIGKDTTSWEETLRKLKEIPDKDVMGKLRISFDALDDGQKQIFLDIACFFIGEEKTNPCYMWEDLKFFPRISINSLVLRSLVKVGDEDELWMHDQLRDLGRKIVGEENFSYGNRLWDHVKAREQFENRTITEKVTGLCLYSRVEFRNFEGEEFGKLPNLRYLDVNCANLVGDFKLVFPNLRWLRWLGNSVPTNFHLKNLVVLDLSLSYITDEWEGWRHIKMATKLKVLNLTACTRLTTTSPISTFATLERLILPFCEGLKGILDCSTFTALESLDLACCSNLRRLDGLEKLESLRYLDLSYCTGLERFPDLSTLKKLTKLVILSCSNLIEIQGVDRLESLEIVGLEVLESLKVLFVSKLEDLTEIEGLEQLKSLEELDISECKSIEILDLSNHKNLKRVRARNCDKLIEIRGLEKLKSLEHLDIYGCYSLQNLPHLPDTSIHSHNSKQTEEDAGYNPSESPPSHGSLSFGEFPPMGMGHRTHNGFELLEENFLTLPSELSKTVAVCEDECSCGGGKSESFWVQLSDGGETNGRRVRQWTEDLISNLGK